MEVDVSGNSASSGVRQSMSTRGLRSIYTEPLPCSHCRNTCIQCWPYLIMCNSYLWFLNYSLGGHSFLICLRFFLLNETYCFVSVQVNGNLLTFSCKNNVQGKRKPRKARVWFLKGRYRVLCSLIRLQWYLIINDLWWPWMQPW